MHKYSVLQQRLEFLHLKQIKESLSQIQQNSAKVIQDENRHVYQRVLGHRYDIPGVRQWTEVSKDTTPYDVCEDWVTGKYRYTLVFWSKDMANKTLKKLRID